MRSSKSKAPNVNHKLQVWNSNLNHKPSFTKIKLVYTNNNKSKLPHLIHQISSMKNKTIFFVTSAAKPTTFFESTIKLIVIGQLWKWLKTFPKIVLTIKTLSGCRLWKACKRCLCLGISKSNNSVQRLSSPWTSDLFLCPSYKIS